MAFTVPVMAAPSAPLPALPALGLLTGSAVAAAMPVPAGPTGEAGAAAVAVATCAPPAAAARGGSGGSCEVDGMPIVCSQVQAITSAVSNTGLEGACHIAHTYGCGRSLVCGAVRAPCQEG